MAPVANLKNCMTKLHGYASKQYLKYSTGEMGPMTHGHPWPHENLPVPSRNLLPFRLTAGRCPWQRHRLLSARLSKRTLSLSLSFVWGAVVVTNLGKLFVGLFPGQQMAFNDFFVVCQVFGESPIRLCLPTLPDPQFPAVPRCSQTPYFNFRACCEIDPAMADGFLKDLVAGFVLLASQSRRQKGTRKAGTLGSSVDLLPNKREELYCLVKTWKENGWAAESWYLSNVPCC